MKKRYLGIVLAGVLTLGTVLSGCGSSKTDYATSSYYDAEAPAATESFAESKAVYEDVDSYNAAAEEAEATNVQDSSRKLITTMNISSETENLDDTLSNVNNKVKELGGYVESSNIYNGSRYSGRTVTRNASITARIPASKLESFVETVEGTTNITNKSTNVEDVTLSYVDIESKKNALKAEEKRLLEIVEKAETVEDIITVENRLSDVRYQIESIESQLRTYDNKVNYSTVYLDITEVTKFSPVKEKTAGERMAEGFVESFKGVINGFVELFVWFVIHIPQLILLVVFGLVVFFIIKISSDRSKKKKAEQMAKMQAAYVQQQGNYSGVNNAQAAAPVQNAQANEEKGNDGK